MTASPSDGKPKKAADKADIFFTQSTDGGATWSDPLRVNDDATTHDQWQPVLAVTPDGSHVGIFRNDRRLDPANNLIDRFGVIGDVSGHAVTFGANFRQPAMDLRPNVDAGSHRKPTIAATIGAVCAIPILPNSVRIGAHG